MSQFFCSTWQPSFLFAGRDRVKVIWLVDTPAQQMVVDELAAIVGVDAQQRERQGRLNLYQGTEHMPGRLFRTLRTSVQPVAMSVTVSEEAKSPLLSPPSWPTRSISTNPGRAWSQSAQVRIGI